MAPDAQADVLFQRLAERKHAGRSYYEAKLQGLHEQTEKVRHTIAGTSWKLQEAQEQAAEAESTLIALAAERRALETERAAIAAEHTAVADEVAEVQRRTATQKEASAQQRDAFIAECLSLEQDIKRMHADNPGSTFLQHGPAD